jgi:hypothetical protein
MDDTRNSKRQKNTHQQQSNRYANKSEDASFSQKKCLLWFKKYTTNDDPHTLGESYTKELSLSCWILRSSCHFRPKSRNDPQVGLKINPDISDIQNRKKPIIFITISIKKKNFFAKLETLNVFLPKKCANINISGILF